LGSGNLRDSVPLDRLTVPAVSKDLTLTAVNTCRPAERLDFN